MSIFPPSSTSRRGFFGTTTATATAAIATSLFGLCPCALAAPSSASTNYDIYIPPPRSLQGKVVFITGGTSGLGLESAKRLAAAGATIMLTGRTQRKGEAAVAHVKEYLEERQIDNPNIYSVPLDLDSLQNVKSITSRLPLRHIDILINNAGVMAIPKRELTEDGYERTFQSNHLGHFVLTATLAPLLAKDARIINVSSLAYLFVTSPISTKADLDIKDLNYNTKAYGPWKSYGDSKLENILFTRELQRRVDESKGQLQWKVLALHPGGVQTNLARYLGAPVVEDTSSKSFLQEAISRVTALFIKTVEQGASTQVYLAAAPSSELQNGAFYSDCRELPLVPAAQDSSLAKALWDASERLGGVSFPVVLS